jgi:hypothetical protein
MSLAVEWRLVANDQVGFRNAADLIATEGGTR